ncbi:uncharacterized protein LOC112347717 [Selaginella moellendorffii]|uniref:uncharacterized protein LOC112347717 n=1 Tax=Selaginella moellendorffii TaxID=88036 RepID=UPI000D1CFC2F|nr:uncharacterized protein LOC112347717 [Selaginella moellendorffii]|eukprot:XP_024534822.1 uncharacterized protein LOC112347717 [Selaginella moellendorffii]
MDNGHISVIFLATLIVSSSAQEGKGSASLVVKNAHLDWGAWCDYPNTTNEASSPELEHISSGDGSLTIAACGKTLFTGTKGSFQLYDRQLPSSPAFNVSFDSPALASNSFSVSSGKNFLAFVRPSQIQPRGPLGLVELTLLKEV